MAYCEVDWPADITDLGDLLAFLSRRTTPSLLHDIYNVDFLPPVFGSYSTDETACVREDGSFYLPLIFGRVCSEPEIAHASCLFRIAAGDGMATSAFNNQLNQLAAVVRDADDDDWQTGTDTRVHICTNTDRRTMAGGTWIEVSSHYAPFYVEEGGILVEKKPAHILDYPLDVGQWVLVQCRLQRWDDRAGFGFRKREISNSKGIEEHHLQAALAAHTVQIPIPGSVRLVENYAELYPSKRWMDTGTYLHSTQTISEACSAALLNHDYTYYMDESNKMWLDNTNSQCRVEERIAQEPRSADTPGICGRLFISEDEFELVMGLFETLTGPQLHQELPDFSIFKPFFLAPLHPDTFASHIVPSWIRPPSVLSSVALTIYPHWHQRRSLRGGRKICHLLNTEEDDHIDAAYVCFRNIPIRTRRVPKSKIGEGTAGRLKAESSVQPLANEREKFENASPRRSQRLKPQGREEQEPLHIMQSYATKVPVSTGAPGPLRDSGTSHLQVSYQAQGLRHEDDDLTCEPWS
ncbi:hypothetical protein B0H14DRAFT_3712033 [Mycena olivaceomarginata]|nr:hypothetical protein B0H14DRAFT_3712033 [Mycena olivaceomarginata]